MIRPSIVVAAPAMICSSRRKLTSTDSPAELACCPRPVNRASVSLRLIDLEPRLLRYFLAVAEELHFGHAAARLYISQPSLSNQIRKLERTLGTGLFVRTSREVRLTAAGQTLLEEAPLALAALERAAERTSFAGAGVTGTVRFGFPPPASFETLGAILAAVENDNPNMTVVPTELFSAEIRGRVLAGELDVGLALHPEPVT
ncbi:MAG: hypothetical protein QOE28_3144, partial [Solirubrobacteraceae bacterium]|nr:hypothetical protein [Solirubrobacteraceae bacterium]